MEFIKLHIQNILNVVMLLWLYNISANLIDFFLYTFIYVSGYLIDKAAFPKDPPEDN